MKATGSVIDSPGISSALVTELHVDPVPERVLGQVGDRGFVAFADGPHQRAAAQHRDAERLEHRIAELRSAQDQLGLELARDRVEAGVEDPRVGAARLPDRARARPRAGPRTTPRRASSSAVADPTTPAPTTAISASMREKRPRAKNQLTGVRQAQYRRSINRSGHHTIVAQDAPTASGPTGEQGGVDSGRGSTKPDPTPDAAR